MAPVVPGVRWRTQPPRAIRCPLRSLPRRPSQAAGVVQPWCRRLHQGRVCDLPPRPSVLAGGVEAEHGPCFLGGPHTPPADSLTGGLLLLPGTLVEEELGPKGVGAALAGLHRIDGAEIPYEEGTSIRVVGDIDRLVTGLVLRHEAPTELLFGEPQMGCQPGRLPLSEVDDSRLAATIATSSTFELQPAAAQYGKMHQPTLLSFRLTGRSARDEVSDTLYDLPPDGIPPYRGEVASRPAYLFLLLVIGLHFTVGSVLQVANPAFGIAFGEFFFFAGLTWLMVRAQNFEPVSFLALRLPSARVMVASLVVALAGFFVAGGVNAINRWIVGPEIASRYDLTGLFQVRSTGEAIFLVLGVAVLAPLGEELVFRGYLHRVLGARYGIVRSMWVTSGLFALIHFNPASILALFTLGGVFAVLRARTGSLWPPILAHAIQNGMSSGLVLSGLAEESPDELPLFQGVLLVAFSLPFLVLAVRFLTPATEEALVVPDPGADHRFRPGRIVRPALALSMAAVAALALLIAVDGPTAFARLQRVGGSPPPPQMSPEVTPSEIEPGP